MNLIFLDIDGVLNCQTFFEAQFVNKKELRKKVKNSDIDRLEFYKSQLCPKRIVWFNLLCEKVNAKVVLSSTWRLGKSIDELREIFSYAGCKFDLIDKTPNLRHNGCLRGNEIYSWIQANIESLSKIKAHNYKSYVIIDDDSDMLLWQQHNFFHTDAYEGLTPNLCWKIERFFGTAE